MVNFTGKSLDLSLLLTNDDGQDSPIFQAFVYALEAQGWVGDLTVAIPSEEQSWVSQSITRFKPLQATEKPFGKSSKGYLITGSPADCVSLAVHNLAPRRPDIVLSGINMGTNAGLPFFMSSGTVGGAAEAFLTGITAVALSLHVPSTVYRAWVARDTDTLDSYSSNWANVARSACILVEELLSTDFFEHCDLASINFPWDTSDSTSRKITKLEPGRFGSLFSVSPDGMYRHQLQGLVFPELETANLEDAKTQTSDVFNLQKGVISITPIRYQMSATLPDNLASIIENK